MSEIRNDGKAMLDADRVSEKPFSLNRGCEGCLAAWLVMFALMLVVSFVLARALQWIDPAQERTIVYFNWLIGLVVGGYVAARRGRTTGWSNSLVVGVFAQLVLVGQLTDGAGMGEWEKFQDLLDSPKTEWPKLMAIVLTIPAALLGGYVSTRRS